MGYCADTFSGHEGPVLVPDVDAIPDQGLIPIPDPGIANCKNNIEPLIKDTPKMEKNLAMKNKP